MSCEIISRIKVADGELTRYRHYSSSLKCEMVFALFTPPQAKTQDVPLLWWLSGLTCNDENFCQKAGAFNKAAELGLAIICPDTSPRGLDLQGEHDSYDFGSGAGFYLNATLLPWVEHYRMYDYVVSELPSIVAKLFAFNGKQSISGHSMGGHGALTIALKNPKTFTSVSAFAPITNPSQCPWGQKAFNGYLGSDENLWKAYDTCELIKQGARVPDILIDQGESDNFLIEQLKPENLIAVCAQAGQSLTLRQQPGYDHSYYFISTFIEEHLIYHANALR
jgi:S-formylglutathione hydrolase